ncbi:Small, acid-soluble spore protein C2 [compost metagenome]
MGRHYNLDQYKTEVANELGVHFGNKDHNRNLTSAQCGAVGGMMIKRIIESAINQYTPTNIGSTYSNQPRIQ